MASRRIVSLFAIGFTGGAHFVFSAFDVTHVDVGLPGSSIDGLHVPPLVPPVVPYPVPGHQGTHGAPGIIIEPEPEKETALEPEKEKHPDRRGEEEEEEGSAPNSGLQPPQRDRSFRSFSSGYGSGNESDFSGRGAISSGYESDLSGRGAISSGYESDLSGPGSTHGQPPRIEVIGGGGASPSTMANGASIGSEDSYSSLDSFSIDLESRRISILSSGRATVVDSVASVDSDVFDLNNFDWGDPVYLSGSADAWCLSTLSDNPHHYEVGEDEGWAQYLAEGGVLQNLFGEDTSQKGESGPKDGMTDEERVSQFAHGLWPSVSWEVVVEMTQWTVPQETFAQDDEVEQEDDEVEQVGINDNLAQMPINGVVQFHDSQGRLRYGVLAFDDWCNPIIICLPPGKTFQELVESGANLHAILVVKPEWEVYYAPNECEGEGAGAGPQPQPAGPRNAGEYIYLEKGLMGAWHRSSYDDGAKVTDVPIPRFNHWFTQDDSTSLPLVLRNDEELALAMGRLGFQICPVVAARTVVIDKSYNSNLISSFGLGEEYEDSEDSQDSESEEDSEEDVGTSPDNFSRRLLLRGASSSHQHHQHHPELSPSSSSPSSSFTSETCRETCCETCNRLRRKLERNRLPIDVTSPRSREIINHYRRRYLKSGKLNSCRCWFPRRAYRPYRGDSLDTDGARTWSWSSFFFRRWVRPYLGDAQDTDNARTWSWSSVISRYNDLAYTPF